MGRSTSAGSQVVGQFVHKPNKASIAFSRGLKFSIVGGKQLNKTPILKRTSRLFLASVMAIAAISLTGAERTSAQQPAPHPGAARASDAPQSTSATYGDWVVQCQNGTPPKKICEVVQVTQMKGKNEPFSRVIIVEAGKGEPLRLVVQVPVNVSFAAKVRVQITASDPGLAAPFARCAQIGCFADFEINEEALKKLRAADGNGKLSFADAAGHDIVIPMSFKGFSAALDALMRA